MKERKTSIKAKKFVSLLKEKIVFFALIEDIKKFKKSFGEIYIFPKEETKKKQTKTSKKLKDTMRMLSKWSDVKNKEAYENKDRNYEYRKGIQKNDAGYFLRTFKREKDTQLFIRKRVKAYSDVYWKCFLKAYSEVIGAEPDKKEIKEIFAQIKAKGKGPTKSSEEFDKLERESFPELSNRQYSEIKKLATEKAILESRKKAIIKQTGYKVARASAVALVITWVFVYPSIRGVFVDKNRDDRPTSEFSTDDTLPNKDVPRDEDGNIIEYPIDDEEMTKVYDRFEGKIVKDLKAHNINIEGIDDIIGIYENKLMDETYGDRNLVEIVVEKDNKFYSLQYVHEGSIKIDTTENLVRTLSSMSASLGSSSLYNVGELTSQKQEILALLGGEKSIYVGDYYEYRSQSGRAIFKIPVYTETSRKTYSINENDVLSEDMIYDEFMSFLRGENGFFLEEEESLVSSQYRVVMDAVDYALQIGKEADMPKEKEEGEKPSNNSYMSEGMLIFLSGKGESIGENRDYFEYKDENLLNLSVEANEREK